LLRAQEQYRLLFDSNPIPVWVFDTATLFILDVNATAVERYGCSREEFLRARITDIRPQEDVPALLAELRNRENQVADSGSWRHCKKGGELIDVQITSYPLTFQGKSAQLVVATDVTEQKRATDALKQSEEMFRLIVSNVKDYAIVVLDPEGQAISWNGGAQCIKGYTKNWKRFLIPFRMTCVPRCVESRDLARPCKRITSSNWTIPRGIICAESVLRRIAWGN
jgi:PAS domain S-box-containing protein